MEATKENRCAAALAEAEFVGRRRPPGCDEVRHAEIQRQPPGRPIRPAQFVYDQIPVNLVVLAATFRGTSFVRAR
jgi:hypothetical protein